MKNKINMWLFRTLLLLALASPLALCAQIDFPSLSPPGSLSQEIGNTTIQVSYERPAVRGRKIFGGLVPWGKVWRTGAGHCTKISFDRPVVVGGQRVDAGIYALFTIPNKEEWMVILNKDTSLYGAHDYRIEDDVIRFKVAAMKSQRFYESVTIDIDFIPNHARIYVSWANTQISFPVETSIDQEIATYIDERLFSNTPEPAENYGLAAGYLIMRNQRYNDALRLIEKGVVLEDGIWLFWMKMELNEHIGNYAEALKAAREGLQFQQTHPIDDAYYQAIDLQNWENHVSRLQAIIEE